MMLKEYCQKHKITAKALAEQCGIPYSTVNDLLNKKTELGRVSFGAICRISDYLGLNLDEFRGLFGEQPDETKQNDAPQIIARNKQYWLLWEGEKVRLCKVTALNERFIEDIAAWTLRDLKVRKQLEEQNALLLNAHR